MTPKYFDAHTHVQFPVFDTDRDEVVARAHEAGVGMNVVGVDLESSKAALSCALRYEGVWATVGLHPDYAGEEVFDLNAYEALARESKVVAIGECGLDYFRPADDTKTAQAEVFVQHIELANAVRKPLMLHIRTGKHAGGDEAYKDALDLIRAHAAVGGDVHFFAGSWDVAKEFLSLGFLLSFTGVVTFTHDYDEVLYNTPLDMLLSETDAPYVTPVPNRGKRNEPMFIPAIARAIARIKNLPEEEVARALLQNASRLFGLQM